MGENDPAIMVRLESDGTSCQAPFGICPEHGRFLRSRSISGGQKMTWCRALGCERVWPYDHDDTPCSEPAWAVLTDTTGHERIYCEMHTRDADMRIRPTPPAIRRLDGLPYVGAPYVEGVAFPSGPRPA
jgi:hypothetical protein